MILKIELGLSAKYITGRGEPRLVTAFTRSKIFRAARSSRQGCLRSLFQFVVFLAGRDQQRDVCVGVFPEREEILIGFARFYLVATERGRAGEPGVSQRIQRRQRIPTAMVDDRSKLSGRLGAVSLFQICLRAHVLRPEVAINVVLARGFQKLYR